MTGCDTTGARLGSSLGNVLQIKWQFNLRVNQKDWNSITTIKQIIDLIVQRSN